MESIPVDLLLCLTTVVVGWAVVIATGITGNMIRAKMIRGTFRKSDVSHLIITGIIAIASTILLYYPNISNTIPSTLTVSLVGSLLPLLYLTEKHIKDWINLCDVFRPSDKQEPKPSLD